MTDLNSVKTKISDKMGLGEFKGLTYKEIAINHPIYFSALVKFYPLLHFDRFLLCTLFIQGKYTIHEAFEIYKENLIKPIQQSINEMRNSFMSNLALQLNKINQLNENFTPPLNKVDENKHRIVSTIYRSSIENEIILNLQADKFDLLKYKNQLELYKNYYKDITSDDLSIFVCSKIKNIELKNEILEELSILERDYNIEQKILSQIKEKMQLDNPFKMLLGLGRIENIKLFNLVLEYSAFFLKKVEKLKKLSRGVASGGSWNCDICGGNQFSGCQYFDITECPKFA